MIKNETWDYMQEGLEAQGHTPIYKMHKYFARRPQNVFSELIKNYSEEGDIILDPFCGGGVSVVEGVALGRNVVASDINPLAAFITKCEATKVDCKDYLRPMNEILEKVRTFSNQYFVTTNRDTGEVLPVRWYEHAYEVICPECGKVTSLESDNKKIESGKAKNGWYTCSCCGADIRAVSTHHVGTKFLTVTYKTTTRETQRTVAPDDFDFKIQAQAEEAYAEKILNGDWFVPDIAIPERWDRQQEDCLIRKGFTNFTDFFTKRTLLVMAYYLRCVQSYKHLVSADVYDLLLLTFSATLRYTNNMTISTSMWQDGRPVAWAKHAYWMSYQFVEVNPVEYIEKRITAIKGALAFQKEKFQVTPVKSEDYQDLIGEKSKFLLFNSDSSNLRIPDESVSLVITDPPYGGNVQYGELSAFWLAWLYQELNISKEYITELTGEILVHRKNKVHAKTHQTYYEGLKRVYSECYRVLKPGQPMVFTFNSKDAKVWMAVIKAAIDAGFVLEPDGLIYQSPIENYKNTAHTMAPGTVHGDFIYTFVKPCSKVLVPEELDFKDLQQDIVMSVSNSIKESLSDNSTKTISELYIGVLKKIIPLLAQLAFSKESFDFTNTLVNGNLIEETIKDLCLPVDKNLWRLNK